MKTALLTNRGFDSAATNRPLIMKDLEHFDVVVLSCELGHRQPDSEIYMVGKDEAIFVCARMPVFNGPS